MKLKKNLTAHDKILEYLKIYEDNVKFISKTDKKYLEEFKVLLFYKINLVKKLNTLNFILYVLLYFSFINLFIPDLFIFDEIKILVSKIISFIGSGFLIIVISLISRTKNLIYTDINLLTISIISIYTKYNDINIYKSFKKTLKEKEEIENLYILGKLKSYFRKNENNKKK